ncbi:ABC transporter ATP-binding protein [Marispirochaeta sp.]|uniref:ABC transporter ATP-binding protein n=1 Tax=Marispirochaeta sp. TaxID=2038653 RepID=UPI0029C63B1B|nr:ABC transporter ATP-binding protein [Marispirochaeta sp.]
MADHPDPIRSDDIRKNYGSVEALGGVSIKAAAGSITGLIGPDGAGKSSFMRIVLGLLSFDGGELILFGETGAERRRGGKSRIGYMPEVFSLYSDLTVEENLRFFFRIHRRDPAGFPARRRRLYRFNRLENFAHARAGTLSGGMKQKLALSCALMHEPELLVLDEPTTGVDPLSRREFWSMLAELKEQGITVLVSTPYMEEALRCDAVYLMNKGRVLAAGTPSALIDSFPGALYEIEDANHAPQELKRELAERFPDCPVFLSGRRVHLALPNGGTPDIGLSVAGTVRRVEPGLEDLFLSSVLRPEKKETS